jgi:hypothetical protein
VAAAGVDSKSIDVNRSAAAGSRPLVEGKRMLQTFATATRSAACRSGAGGTDGGLAMATDIKLDQQGGNWLVAESQVLKSTATDLMLDAQSRRRGGPSTHRRALVHDYNDGLTLNYAGDYPGGVTLTGDARVSGDLRVVGELAVDGGLLVDGERVESTRFLESNLRWAEDRIAALEKTVEALLSMAGAVVVPGWTTKTEILEGDDMGMVHRSAEDLGLIVEYVIDQRRPGFDHEQVISIEPSPGTVLMRGSTVVVTLNLEG